MQRRSPPVSNPVLLTDLYDFLQVDGGLYGSPEAWSRRLALPLHALRARLFGIQECAVEARCGRRRVRLYAESDMRRACAELLSGMPVE